MTVKEMTDYVLQKYAYFLDELGFDYNAIAFGGQAELDVHKGRTWPNKDFWYYHFQDVPPFEWKAHPHLSSKWVTVRGANVLATFDHPELAAAYAALKVKALLEEE